MKRKALIIAGVILLSAAIAASAAPRRNFGGHHHGDDLDLPEDGLLIARVFSDSPAEKAGLQRGDILKAIDGAEVNNLADVHGVLETYRAGQQLSLGIQRGDEIKTVKLTLEERLYRAPIGIEFAPGPGMHFFDMEMPAFGEGVFVVEVQEDSPAESAGLRRGDVILEVDGESAQIDEFVAVIQNHKSGDLISVLVARPGEDEMEEVTITVRLGENEGEAFLGVHFAPGFPLRRGTFDSRLRRFGNQPGNTRIRLQSRIQSESA